MRKIALGIAVLCLSACAMKQQAAGLSCPATGLVQYADQAVFWQGDKLPQAEQGILSKAYIGSYRGACRPSKKGGADMVLEIDFGVRRGSAGAALEEQKLSYFVAVLGRDESILTRQPHELTLEFDKKGFGGATESLDLHIPVEKIEDAASYKILLGFALTEQQVAFNKGSAP